MKGKNYTEVEIKIALGKKVYMLPTHILEEIGEKNNVGGRVRGIWEIEEGGRIFINIVNKYFYFFSGIQEMSRNSVNQNVHNGVFIRR